MAKAFDISWTARGRGTVQITLSDLGVDPTPEEIRRAIWDKIAESFKLNAHISITTPLDATVRQIRHAATLAREAK